MDFPVAHKEDQVEMDNAHLYIDDSHIHASAKHLEPSCQQMLLPDNHFYKILPVNRKYSYNIGISTYHLKAAYDLIHIDFPQVHPYYGKLAYSKLCMASYFHALFSSSHNVLE